MKNNFLKIKLSKVSISESCSSEGEEILLKFKELSGTHELCYLNMLDYVKFCFVGSSKIDFQEPSEDDVKYFGSFGAINKMKIYISKDTEEGTVLAKPKILN